jgi:formylglycine-generating enzyme required for sulfatase activity
MKFPFIVVFISLLFTGCSTSTLSGLTIGSSQISPKDGMTLLYVPEGEFIMGTSDAQMNSVLSEYSQFNPDLNKDFFKSEQPQHKVWLNAYWIDKTEITNAMYAK